MPPDGGAIPRPLSARPASSRRTPGTAISAAAETLYLALLVLARAAYPPPELVPTPAEDASLGKLPSDLPWRLGLVTISRNAGQSHGPRRRGEGEPPCLALHVPSRHPAWVNIYTTVPRRRRAPFRPPRELPFRHVHSVLDCTLSRSPPIPRGPVSLFLSVESRPADDRAAPWSDSASRRRSWPPRLPRASLRRHRPRRPSPAPTLSNTRMTLRYVWAHLLASWGRH